MNKSEFITALQAKTGLAKADVTKLVNAYGEVVIEAVSKGNPDPGRPRRPLLRLRQLQGSREVIR